MRYTKAFDIWQVPEYLHKHIPIGQWVYTANDPTAKGQWCGIRSTGSRVVVWYHKDRAGYSAKRKTLMQYAKD